MNHRRQWELQHAQFRVNRRDKFHDNKTVWKWEQGIEEQQGLYSLEISKGKKIIIYLGWSQGTKLEDVLRFYLAPGFY